MFANEKSIKVNFIMNALLTMSSFIFPLITFPYVSRILLPEGMGKVALATSIISYLALFAGLGIPTYGVRACAQVRDNKIALSKVVHELFLINIATTVICYGIFLFMLFLLPKLASEKTLYIITSSTIILQTLSVEWLYRALEEYSYITYRSLAFKIVAVVMMFLLIHHQSDYVIYGAISVLAACGSAVANLYNLRKLIVFTPFSNYDLKKHLKPIMSLFATSCAIIIYVSLNTVMLGFMKTNADVGLYDSAMKIKSVLTAVVASLGVVILPRASYYIQQNNYNEFNRICTKGWHFVCLIGLPLVVYFIFFAQNGIRFLSGAAFEGAIVPMQIVMPTVLFIGMTNIIGIQVLVPLGRENDVLCSVMAGATVDLILCYMLIPMYGVVGAAIANCIAELVVLVVQVILVLKHRDKFDIVAAIKGVSYWKIVVALMAGIFVSIGCKNLQISHFCILVISGSIFMFVYWICLLILRESFVLEIVDQLWQKIYKVR